MLDMGQKRDQKDKSEGWMEDIGVAQCPSWSLGGHIWRWIRLVLELVQNRHKLNCELQFCRDVCI
jgi:hypothetical protein